MLEQITITLPEMLQEDIPVEGNATNSGDLEYDKRVEEEIYNRLNQGDISAWFCAKVTASWKGLTGTDYLGCCNYLSLGDFMKKGGYYEDMKKNAYNELIKGIKALGSRL